MCGGGDGACRPGSFDACLCRGRCGVRSTCVVCYEGDGSAGCDEDRSVLAVASTRGVSLYTPTPAA